jgi:hypothetical protein
MLIKEKYLTLPAEIVENPLPTDPYNQAICLCLISAIKQINDYSKQNYPNNQEYKDGWTRLSARHYSKILQTRTTWKQNIEMLIEEGILERNKFFIVGVIPRHYRISPKYQVMEWNDYLETDLFPQIGKLKRKGFFYSPNDRLCKAFLNSKKKKDENKA